MSFNGNQYPNYADKVITTRGDMVRGDASGDRERLGIGSANQILQSDGTDPAWATLSTAASVLTTQGDILYEGAAGLARLGQSTDGHVLTTKGAAANPVWAAVAAGATTTINTYDTSGGLFSTTSTSMVDITDFKLTCGSSGKIIANFLINFAVNAPAQVKYELEDDGSSESAIMYEAKHGNEPRTVTMPIASVCSSQDIQVKCQTSTGTLNIYQGTNGVSQAWGLEVV